MGGGGLWIGWGGGQASFCQGSGGHHVCEDVIWGEVAGGGTGRTVSSSTRKQKIPTLMSPRSSHSNVRGGCMIVLQNTSLPLSTDF